MITFHETSKFLESVMLTSKRLENTDEWLLHFLTKTMFILGVLVLLILQFVPAPYGKYVNYKLGWHVPIRSSWIVQECPSFFIPLYLLISNRLNHEGPGLPLANMLGLAMFMVHYFQRSFIYPLLIRGGKPLPVIGWTLCFIFCISNGYMQGKSLTNPKLFPPAYLTSLQPIIGIVLFLIGFAINLHSDNILRNLRKPGETGYKIPRGGAFEYVSGANFLGEMLEWTGYAIYCWTLPSFAFAFFTYANLVPRAVSHHNYYIQKFGENYPKSRRAIFPGVL